MRPYRDLLPIWLAMTAGLLLAAGCMTREILPPARETTLIVTRAGTTAHLQWESARGVFYSVYYSDGRRNGGRWMPLAGAVRLPGTGQLMQVSDPQAGQSQRMYRLQTE
ncbi:MAG: hypothetical protein K9N49_02960 [Candidatus Marinimicrobia bacterium]|nr:hypothetical protein [Candidatus Neomarinimicrobiota bacterium]